MLISHQLNGYMWLYILITHLHSTVRRAQVTAARRRARFGNDGCVSHLRWLIIDTVESFSHHFNTLSSARSSARGSNRKAKGGEERFEKRIRTKRRGRGLFDGVQKVSQVPRCSFARRWWMPHRPQSACLRWGRPGNGPWSAAAAAWWSGGTDKREKWMLDYKRRTEIHTFRCKLTSITQIWDAERLKKLDQTISRFFLMSEEKTVSLAAPSTRLIDWLFFWRNMLIGAQPSSTFRTLIHAFIK